MSRPSAEQVAQRAFDLGLIDGIQMQEVWSSLGSRNVPLEALVQVLVRREFLTNYQVDRLLKGERSGFFFGDYKVLYLIGTGTFARVYRAVNPKTNQIVAVKVLRRKFSEQPSQYGQFVREGELGCTLRHPNIVPIFEVYSHRGTHFLVMEFVEGRNLREFIKIRRRLDVVEATRLMTDIASAMQYAFEMGLTHRDLKTSNVLVSSRGRAKLVDFGMAGLGDSLGDQSPDSVSPRTIDYAALERATGVRKDDTRSDIYFMGCIYYHMLTGKAPLPETRDRVHRLSKTRFTQVRPLLDLEPSIPPVVEHVVNKAMMLDPLRRYQSPGMMLTDLRTTARRLAGEDVADGKDSGSSPDASPDVQDQQTIMVVEANQGMQNALREGLKRAGYRVLLTSDPVRALERLQDDTSEVTCVLIDAQELGEPAVTAFNRLADHPATAHMPALLLLDEAQMAWSEEVRADEKRVVILLPITMKKLRMALVRLLRSKTATEPSQEGVG